MYKDNLVRTRYKVPTNHRLVNTKYVHRYVIHFTTWWCNDKNYRALLVREINTHKFQERKNPSQTKAHQVLRKNDELLRKIKVQGTK